MSDETVLIKPRFNEWMSVAASTLTLPLCYLIGVPSSSSNYFSSPFPLIGCHQIHNSNVVSSLSGISFLLLFNSLSSSVAHFFSKSPSSRGWRFAISAGLLVHSHGGGTLTLHNKSPLCLPLTRSQANQATNCLQPPQPPLLGEFEILVQRATSS